MYLGYRKSTRSCGKRSQFAGPQRLVWTPNKGTNLTIFFEGTVTGQLYQDMLRTSILPAFPTLFGNDRFYFQQDGASPHFNRELRAYLNKKLPEQ